MTPNSIPWAKVTKNNEAFYVIGDNEYSYSHEEPGIQMTFNKKITFDKEKRIFDEIIDNINSTSQKAELVVLKKKRPYRLH